MSEVLFLESYNLLDDPRFNEEDSIEQIEALVKIKFPNLSASSLERLVLDILIAHHHKKDPKDAARAQTITTSIATPITQNPLSDLETPVLIPSDTEEPHQNDSMHKGELSNSPRAVVSEREPKKKTPFDLLRELLGEDNSNEDIERILTHNDYHLERTIGMLSGKLPDIELNKEQMASRIMCRYFLSGNCIRGSQCMYSHDGSSRICRFWLHQKCIMGDECIFMHDVPTEVVEEVVEKPQTKGLGLPNLQSLPNLSKLPALGQKQSKKKGAAPASSSYQKVSIKPKLASVKSILGESGRGSVPIIAPRSIPWVSKSEGVNSQYVELRLSAASHAETRNKFLQESTNAWSFNDAAKAKVLSAKGRDAEHQMIEQYRNAADLLWEYQLKPGAELWVDLHGLELIEAIDELESKLIEVAKTQRHMPRIMYVISGRGHFKAKKYADQLTQYVLAMLDSKGYKHRDFGVDPTFGRITGVDPWSSLTGPK